MDYFYRRIAVKFIDKEFGAFDGAGIGNLSGEGTAVNGAAGFIRHPSIEGAALDGTAGQIHYRTVKGTAPNGTGVFVCHGAGEGAVGNISFVTILYQTGKAAACDGAAVGHLRHQCHDLFGNAVQMDCCAMFNGQRAAGQNPAIAGQRAGAFHHDGGNRIHHRLKVGHRRSAVDGQHALVQREAIARHHRRGMVISVGEGHFFVGIRQSCARVLFSAVVPDDGIGVLMRLLIQFSNQRAAVTGQQYIFPVHIVQGHHAAVVFVDTGRTQELAADIACLMKNRNIFVRAVANVATSAAGGQHTSGKGTAVDGTLVGHIAGESGIVNVAGGVVRKGGAETAAGYRAAVRGGAVKFAAGDGAVVHKGANIFAAGYRALVGHIDHAAAGIGIRHGAGAENFNGVHRIHDVRGHILQVNAAGNVQHIFAVRCAFFQFPVGSRNGAKILDTCKIRKRCKVLGLDRHIAMDNELRDLCLPCIRDLGKTIVCPQLHGGGGSVKIVIECYKDALIIQFNISQPGDGCTHAAVLLVHDLLEAAPNKGSVCFIGHSAFERAALDVAKIGHSAGERAALDVAKIEHRISAAVSQGARDGATVFHPAHILHHHRGNGTQIDFFARFNGQYEVLHSPAIARDGASVFDTFKVRKLFKFIHIDRYKERIYIKILCLVSEIFRDQLQGDILYQPQHGG